MTPVQLVFELLKTQSPLTQTQRESLLGDAEQWWRQFGQTKDDGSEPSKLELSIAKILKSWWCMTLLACAFIPLKRLLLDYMNGNIGSGEYEDDDRREDEEEDEEEDDRPRRSRR